MVNDPPPILHFQYLTLLSHFLSWVQTTLFLLSYKSIRSTSKLSKIRVRLKSYVISIITSLDADLLSRTFFFISNMWRDKLSLLILVRLKSKLDVLRVLPIIWPVYFSLDWPMHKFKVIIYFELNVLTDFLHIHEFKVQPFHEF